MTRKRERMISTAALIAAAMSAKLAHAAPPATQPETNQQLLEDVRELRAEMNQMKAERAAEKAAMAQAPAATQPGHATANETASQAVAPFAATESAVEADATRRSYLFSDNDSFTAGYENNRFVIQSQDGNFVFRPWLHFQGRYVVSDRQDFKTDGSAEVDSGFELRRMRFGFDGNLFSPDLTYFFNWATVRASGSATVTSGGHSVGTVSNNLGGTPLLEEAWVRYRLPHSNFFLKGGQIKDPVLHDQIVSSRYQQTTERSLTGDIFTNGDAFTEGATIAYDPNTFWRVEAGVNHGLRSANTNFLDYPNSNAFNFGVVGRLEYKVMGKWSDYSQIGGQGTKDPLLVFGLGADMSERGHANQTVAAADAMFVLPQGLNVYGAFVDRYTDHNFGIATQSATGASIAAPPADVADTATNEYSLLGQAGYLLDKQWEPFGRIEYMHLAGTAAGSHNYIPAIFAGVNYYFVGHRCKLTGQGVYLPRGIPIDDTPNDVLASPSGHGEFVFITQLQLLL